MAGLRNTLSPRAGSARAGVFAVGDAYGHSDPVLAHGLAFALVHADMVATALRDHRDVADAHAAYVASTHPELAERYALSTALDEQRHRMWTGGPVDVTRHDGDYALFTMAAGGAAATVDGDVARVFLRRVGLLDSTSVLDGDVSTQLRIESVSHDLMASGGRPPGPTRDEMLAAVSAATASVR
jgi:flavin-dependent dehydrogenase